MSRLWFAVHNSAGMWALEVLFIYLFVYIFIYLFICILQPMRACLAMPVGELGPFGVAEVALRLLHSLVGLQPAEGEGGRTLFPLPLVHRHIAGPTCLPHIAQAMLITFNDMTSSHAMPCYDILIKILND